MRQIKRKLITDIKERFFRNNDINNVDELIDFLPTLIEDNQISKKSLQRYFKDDTEPREDKASILATILGFSDFNEYVQSKKYDKVYTKNIPKALVSLPLIESSEVIGREKEIEDLQQIFNTTNKLVLVNGIGGIGKTTLAKHFLSLHINDFNHLAWIEVGSSVKSSFVARTDLIDSLGLSNQIDKFKNDKNFIDKSFEIITNRMRQLPTTKDKPYNLLVIDNVTEEVEELDILDYISLKPYWKVLMTSRESLESFRNYEVDTLTNDYAMVLFYYHYKIEENDDIVDQILKLIDYHTLGIEIIAKTSNSLRLKLKDILILLKKKGLNISKNTNIKLKHNKNRRLKSIMEYLLVIFDIANLSKEQNLILTQFVALPSKYIPYQGNKGNNLIDFLDLKGEDKYKFTNNLNGIVKKGWLQWNKKKDLFKLHKLIQDVLKKKLIPDVEKCKILITSLNERLVYQNLDYDSYTYSTNLEKVIKGDLDLNFAEFLDNLSTVTLRLDEFKRAISLQKKSLNIRLNKNANKDIISDSYNGLALAYKEIGNYKKALEYQLKDLEIVQNKKYSYELAVTYNNLSLIYRLINTDFKDAYKYQKKAIKINEKINDFDLNIILYNNMGNLLYLDGKFKQAIPYLEKSLTFRVNHDDDLFEAEAYYNLALSLSELAKYDEALSNLFKSLNIQKKYNIPTSLSKLYINISKCYTFLNKKNTSKKYLTLFEEYYSKIDINNVDKKEMKKLLNLKKSILLELS